MTKIKLNSEFKQPNGAFFGRISALMADDNVKAVMIAKRKDYPTNNIGEYQIFVEEVI